MAKKQKNSILQPKKQQISQAKQKIVRKAKRKQKKMIKKNNIQSKTQQQFQKEYGTILKQQKLDENRFNMLNNQSSQQIAQYQPQIQQQQSNKHENQNMKDKLQKINPIILSDQLMIWILDNSQCYRIQNLAQNEAKMSIVNGLISTNGQLKGCHLNIELETTLVIQGTSKTIIKAQSAQNSQKNQITAQLNKLFNLHIQDNNSEQIFEQNKCYNKIVIASSDSLVFQSCNKDSLWQNLNFDDYLSNQNKTTLLVGQKNSGKSTLCEYLLNKVKYSGIYTEIEMKQKITNQLCVIDCDIGRNQTYSGSVSLKYVKVLKNSSQPYIYQEKSIWVGQFTPLNFIPTLLKAIKFLYSLYRQKYFTCNLIINTMGYLTGIGELLLCEIFHITKPHQVLFMETKNIVPKKGNPINKIKSLFQSGQYLQKLYFSTDISASFFYFNQIQKPLKNTVAYRFYQNSLASKKLPIKRFEALLIPNKAKPIQTLDELLSAVFVGKLKKLKSNFEIYEQDKAGKLNCLEWVQYSVINMRLLILGSTCPGQDLLEIKGLAYGWNSQVYCHHQLLKNLGNSTPVIVISQGLDLQKSFYQVTESRLIELEQIMGEHIPYMMPNIKILGNKGMRNYKSRK